MFVAVCTSFYFGLYPAINVYCSYSWVPTRNQSPLVSCVIFLVHPYYYYYYYYCRSRWSRGLRRVSAAVCFLGLRVRITPGHGCRSLVSVVCCQVEVSASDWSFVQRGPPECGVSNEFDREGEVVTLIRIEASQENYYYYVLFFFKNCYLTHSLPAI